MKMNNMSKYLLNSIDHVRPATHINNSRKKKNSGNDVRSFF